MATYSSVCSRCGKVYEYKSPIADRVENRPVCCGQKTDGVILHAPPGFVDTPAAGK